MKLGADTETRVHPLDLGRVVLPAWHPHHDDGDGTAPVFGFALVHDEGVMVVDTGVGTGSEFIDDLYSPTVVPIVDALNAVGIDERDVDTIANTHLHFDHCGQNDALGPVPVWVTEQELDAAEQALYTVPEWAAIPEARLRIAEMNEIVGPGIQLVPTPGHTPGHQSVLITQPDGEVDLIVGQCCYDRAEYDAGRVSEADMHRPGYLEIGMQSLDRLRRFEPRRVWFSHEAAHPRP